MAGKEWGLRPLAFNLDNGWSSDIAVANIKAMTDKLNVDLETYVVDYEEVKTVLKSFMKAGLPWIDGATDRAIKSSMYTDLNGQSPMYLKTIFSSQISIVSLQNQMRL